MPGIKEPLLSGSPTERGSNVAAGLEGTVGVSVLPDVQQQVTAAQLRRMNWRPDVVQKGIGTVMGVYVPCMVCYALHAACVSSLI